jgi:hypothetical protein
MRQIFVFIVEIEEHAGLRHAGKFCDLVERGPAEALFREHGETRTVERFKALLSPLFIRSGFFGHWHL